jgi:hypothetical protein
MVCKSAKVPPEIWTDQSFTFVDDFLEESMESSNVLKS